MKEEGSTFKHLQTEVNTGSKSNKEKKSYKHIMWVPSRFCMCTGCCVSMRTHVCRKSQQ